MDPLSAAPLISRDDEETNAVRDGRLEKNPMTVRKGIMTAMTLSIPILLQASNMSILTTTQSAIVTDLEVYSQASWLTSAYLIPMASFTPIIGRLCEIFRPSSCLVVATTLFAFGALTAGTATGLVGFLVGRAMCGLAASATTPISTILVLQLAPVRYRGLFIGLVNSGYTFGVSLGSISAGALVETVGWRVLFTIQAPVALLAAISIHFIFRKPAAKRQIQSRRVLISKLGSIDYAGVVLLTSSLVLLSIAVTTSSSSPLLSIASAATFAFFILVESHIALYPVIPIHVLQSRALLATCLTQVFLMSCRWAVLFYCPIYAIALRSWSPVQAGAILLPANIGFALGGITVGWLHIRENKSYYVCSLASILVFAISIWLLSQRSTPDSPIKAYVFILLINGFCTGAALNYTLSHVLYRTNSQTHFIAISLASTFRSFASSLGSVFGAAIFIHELMSTARSDFDHKGLVVRDKFMERLQSEPLLVASLKGDEREIAVHSYIVAFKVLFSVTSAFALVAQLVQGFSGRRKPVSVERTSKDSDNRKLVAEECDAEEVSCSR